MASPAAFLGFVAFLAVIAAPSASQTSSVVEYKGRELKGDTFLCRSSEVAEAGFVRDLGTLRVDQTAAVSKQSRVTTWRITLRGATAEVITFSGATQALERPEVYGVERTTGGLLLVWQSREAGQSPQIITIDALNSSFVYSTQHVNPLANKANVFFGSCQPYV